MELSETRNEIRGASGEMFATKDDRERKIDRAARTCYQVETGSWRASSVSGAFTFPAESRNGVSAFSVVVSLFYKPRREQRRRGERQRDRNNDDPARRGNTHADQGYPTNFRRRGNGNGEARLSICFNISRESPTTNAIPSNTITESRNQNFTREFSAHFSAERERERGGSF